MLPVLAAAIVVSAIASWTTPALAQGALKPAVIAIIDSRRLFSESKVSEDIRQQLTKVSQQYATEENSEREKVLKEKDELEKQRGLLVQEAFEEKYTDLKRRADQLNRKIDLHQKQLNVAQMRANRELQKVLNPIIKQVAEQRGATLILEQSQIVWQTDGLDITKSVIELLDKQLPSLKVQIPTEAEIIEMENQARQGGGQ
ncbi:MAG TPA: OmpH family outer membrane protein [Sphingomonadales bacterium]